MLAAVMAYCTVGLILMLFATQAYAGSSAQAVTGVKVKFLLFDFFDYTYALLIMDNNQQLSAVQSFAECYSSPHRRCRRNSLQSQVLARDLARQGIQVYLDVNVLNLTARCAIAQAQRCGARALVVMPADRMTR